MTDPTEPADPKGSSAPTALVFRQLTGSEAPLFRSMPEPGLLGRPITGVEYRTPAEGGDYRPEWSWVALRDGVVVPRAAHDRRVGPGQRRPGRAGLLPPVPVTARVVAVGVRPGRGACRHPGARAQPVGAVRRLHRSRTGAARPRVRVRPAGRVRERARGERAAFIAGSTDQGNVPMAAHFARAGYPVAQERINMV